MLWWSLSEGTTHSTWHVFSEGEMDIPFLLATACVLQVLGLTAHGRYIWQSIRHSTSSSTASLHHPRQCFGCIAQPG